MYFSEHELVVEIDEKGHLDRNQNKENERQIKTEKRLNCKFHRINLDAEHFYIFVEISKIQNYITKSNEEKMKSKFARELLSYMSSISKPLKYNRYFIKKNTTNNIKMSDKRNEKNPPSTWRKKSVTA